MSTEGDQNGADPMPKLDVDDPTTFFIQRVNEILKGQTEKDVSLEKLPNHLSWMRGRNRSNPDPITVRVVKEVDQIGLSWRAAGETFQLGLYQGLPIFTSNKENIPLSEDLTWHCKLVLIKGNQVASRIARLSKS